MVIHANSTAWNAKCPQPSQQSGVARAVTCEWLSIGERRIPLKRYRVLCNLQSHQMPLDPLIVIFLATATCQGNILVGECSAFLASGSDPTDESRMTPDHTTKRSERTGSLHERVD